MSDLAAQQRFAQIASGLGLTDAEIEAATLVHALPGFVDPLRAASDLNAQILTADGWRPLRRPPQGDARR